MKLIHNDEKYIVIHGTLEELENGLKTIEIEKGIIKLNLKLVNTIASANAVIGILNTIIYLNTNNEINGIVSLFIALMMSIQIKKSKKLDNKLDDLEQIKEALIDYQEKNKITKTK